MADAVDAHGEYIYKLANRVPTKTLDQIKMKICYFKYKRVKIAKSLRLLAQKQAISAEEEI